MNTDTSGNRDDLPVDLSALDPARNPARFELAVDAIMRDVTVRRQLVSRSPFTALASQLDHWRRRTVAAAALVSLAAACVLLLIHASPAPVTSTPSGLAAAVGIPPVLAAAMETNTLPNAADLLETFASTRSAP